LSTWAKRVYQHKRNYGFNNISLTQKEKKKKKKKKKKKRSQDLIALGKLEQPPIEADGGDTRR